MTLKSLAAVGILTLAGALAPLTSAGAEANEIRISEQFGIGYLPFLVMKKGELIEKQAAKDGLGPVSVKWLKFGSGSVVNDALIAGNLDFASAGIPAFLTLWNKTKGSTGVKVAAGLDNMPVYLNTINPKIRSIRDFTASDRIALAAVKVSLHAVILQMAAAKEWGQDEFARLDKLTVSMKHPDGMIALLSGKSEITSHFTSPPFMYQELEHPGVRTVLNSADLLGPHNFNVVYTTSRFRDQSPRLYKAFLAALDEAMDTINADKRAAAQLYVDSTPAKDQFDLTYKILTDPKVEFTTVPNGLGKFADFMSRVGTIRKPDSWRDLCFPEAASKPGS